MTRSAINLNAPAAQRVISELKRSEKLSSVELFEHVDLPQSTINSILSLMHKKAIIHISGWNFNKHGMPVKRYSWGQGVDAPEPVRARKPKQKLENPSKLPWPRCDVAASWIKL